MNKTQTQILKIIPYFKPWTKLVLVLLVLVVINTVLTISQPFLTAYIIDNFIAKGNLEGMNWWIVALIFSFVFQALATYFSTTTVGTISQGVLVKIRNDLFAKVQQLPMQFFLANKSGDIISRLNNDTRKIDNFFGQYIFQFISNFFVFVGIGLFMFTQDVLLAFVAWIMVVILVVFSLLIGPLVVKNSKKQLESSSLITSFLNENITNYKAVSAFNQQQNLNTQFKTLIDKYYSDSLKLRILVGIFRPIYNFAGLFSYILVVIVGLYQVQLGTLSVGIVIGFLLYVQKFYDPINRLAAVYGSFQQATGAWARITEVFELDPEAQNMTLTKVGKLEEKDIQD